MTDHIPPRAERLVRWSLAPWERHAILGDLQEEAGTIAATNGGLAARRWYWRQAIWSVWPNVVRRLKGDERRLQAFHSSLGLLVAWICLALLQIFGRAASREPHAFIAASSWILFSISRMLN